MIKSKFFEILNYDYKFASVFPVARKEWKCLSSAAVDLVAKFQNEKYINTPFPETSILGKLLWLDTKVCKYTHAYNM